MLAAVVVVKRKERSVEELYNVTEMIVEPEITPILRGSCRMQGPVDETNHDNKKNMVSSQAEKRSGKHSMSQKVLMRVESGTCNVCSAPCSSCMHRNLARMGSKTEEFSDETCRVTIGSQYSVNEGDVLPSLKSRACDSLHHTTSEASNLHSVNSSHDSFSENADSKATMRSSDISDASEDVDMLPKLSSGKTGAVDQLAPKLERVSDQKISCNKFEDSKGVEGHDDNISCVSRANDANIAVSENIRNVENKNLSHSPASVHSLGPEGSGKALFSQKLASSENCSSKEADIDSSSPIVRSPNSHSESGKPPIGGGSEVSMKFHRKLEAETDKDSGDPPDEAFKHSEQDEQDEKSNELVELPDMQEPPSQALSGDDSDESDIVEHDVKVCDICGDAGREDLLAICSRCSDGAEHTYCMKEMLQKVPDGDWLCEECKLAEETENEKQGSDAEEKRITKGSSSMQSSVKRQAENVEVPSSAKRQAIETSLGSPMSSSPSRVAALSRDSSFKSLDKGKIKLAHQMSFGNQSGKDILETARSPTAGPRLQTPKGTFSKCNSFNTLNSKPKVKLVDEVIPQKLKGTREHAPLDLKEGTTRVVGKSMSFKSANSGRSTSSESKFKILPSKYSHVQDLKGLKPVKDRNAFERKNLSKLDRSLTCSTTASSTVSTPKADQKLTPRGETNSLFYASNNKESKVVQSDVKASTLSKSNSTLTRKGVEIPVNSVGVSSANGICSSSAEQKLNQVSPKDEPSSSSSWTSERPSNNVNGILQDGVPRSLESINQGEKTRDRSVSRTKPYITTGLKGVPCQKCKEIGHAAEHCPNGSLQASVTNSSTARDSRDEMKKGNETKKGSKLKAAIEAAMQKRPGIFGKNKVPDQLDGLSVSSMELNSESAFQDQLSVSNKMKTMVSVEYEGQVNLQSCSSESHKQAAINNAKQLNSHAADIRVEDSDSIIPSVGKPTMSDWPSHALATAASAIPEHEYIWQGGFEVHRGGKLPDLCGGIQAHLSTCASPKVLEVVNQLSNKIPLIEVPRLSTWPTQFHNNGAKEDNIALYFFAKDIESYEKNYKGLLDSMIKNDLALKGNFDGVELLIFPSNQLPENCQRWNMLFFLWGVCRGRRVNCSNSPKNSSIPSLPLAPQVKTMSSDVMSLSQKLCSPKHINKETFVCDGSFNTVLASNAPDKMCITVNGDRGNKVSLLQEASMGLQRNSEQQDNRRGSIFLSRIATGNEQLYPEMRRTSPSLEEVGRTEHRMETDLKPSLEATGTSSGSDKAEKRQMHWDASQVKVEPSVFKNLPVGNQAVVGSVGEEKMSDRMNSDRDRVKLERNLKEDDGFMDTETASERNLTIKGLNPLQSNQRKRPYLDLTETACQTSTGTSQKMPLNDLNSVFVDGDSICKRLKTEFSRMHECSSSRGKNSFSDDFTAQIKDLGSSSLIEEKICDDACDEKVIPEDLGTTEMYFFPVESHHAKDFRLGEKSMPWKKHSSEDGDQFHDGIPNLELALGAETKSPNKGILPFLAGLVDKNGKQDKSPEKLTVKEEKEDVSASLSLSLSFPFPDKEQTVKPVSISEQLLPERRHVNTSLLLFGDFLDK